ncbi:LysM peptidoglycan-binding domain-containing protein [Thalassotalea sp. 1_MG-2023]|uniref:LysM peptidoglycan-binding domain-containing protein n=1 Tax=Thalassotalea sp. 1_MG-2023 TaxID=3062680 RepID=UPI0026E349F8|nr:LysM peptidoglycan-binding domain-containing protein [Thalassotalea sp. 1_MG-2023]MDO6427788.1 LysM peptidoglycan-binding domain-containing protein [Thalassotalea sp. 1_MG-2023]
MKYLSFPLSALVILTGCQTISDNNTKQAPKNQIPEHIAQQIASPVDVSHALLADETADVIHPVEDVDIPLEDNIILDDGIWQRIRNQLVFEIPENRRVTVQRDWYAKHQAYLDRVAKRAEPFMHFIVQEIEAAGIPMDIALLPIVESAFDPFAYSHGRASGMWQFVPGTGTRFGMKQNWWYDGRRDVVASTKGAIKYLKYLHKFFDGNWMHALAAYNSGEGRVQRAIRNNKKRNKPTDFWSLDLPRETRAYVPKLLALADLVKRPKEFKLSLYKIADKPVISVVDIGSQLDLAKAAELANLTLKELQHLNPGFNRWATDPKGPHYLVLPDNKVSAFKLGLNKLSKKERLAWQRYKIKRGDSLGIIANRFNTDIGVIKQVNNIRGTQIREGKHLLIPVAAKSLDKYILSSEQRLAKKQNYPRGSEKLTHIVKSGDTFWDLSRAYGVNYRKLAAWNGMAPRDSLRIGQKLVIWRKSKVTTAATPSSEAIVRNITYRVRKGDSFARIANKFNVTIKEIERWNNLSRKKYLQPGQKLKLAIDITKAI